jgi:hypothetical protein
LERQTALPLERQMGVLFVVGLRLLAIGVRWQANYRYGLGENWEFCGEIDLSALGEKIEF